MSTVARLAGELAASAAASQRFLLVPRVPPTAMWMIRAGNGSENVDHFLLHGIAAIGDPWLGPLSPAITKDELLYANKYPEEKEGSRASWAGQLFRFLTEVKTGDAVATYDRERRKYLLGRITSDTEWAPALIESLPHVRRYWPVAKK